MNQITHLYQLQKTDTEIRNINVRLEEIEKIISNDKTINKAELLLQNKTNICQEAKKTVNRIEDSVKIIEEKIKNNENSLYGGIVKNPKELQDLQSENESLKRRVSSIEEEQLEAMIELENAEKQNQIAKEKLTEAQSSFATRQASLLGEKNQIQQKLNNLLTERQVIIGSVSQEYLKIYEKLLQKKNYLAVVQIEDDSCPACGTNVRPYELQTARSPNQITFCSSCGRILYAT